MRCICRDMYTLYQSRFVCHKKNIIIFCLSDLCRKIKTRILNLCLKFLKNIKNKRKIKKSSNALNDFQYLKM